MGYKVINLRDIYKSIGENRTKEILKDYKCSLNNDVEYFLKDRAIEFSKRDIARTFIVMSPYRGKDVIAGYFAITNKATIVKTSILSKTKRRSISEYGKYEEELKGYYIALPLIGQLGKNYNNGYDKLITGDILLKLACDKIKQSQDIIGGRYVFLECQDNDKLREFYESNGFICFGKRNLEKDEIDRNEGEYLLQMLRDLEKYSIE